MRVRVRVRVVCMCVRLRVWGNVVSLFRSVVSTSPEEKGARACLIPCDVECVDENDRTGRVDAEVLDRGHFRVRAQEEREHVRERRERDAHTGAFVGLVPVTRGQILEGVWKIGVSVCVQ